jgi:hypothetical protein
MFLPGSFIGGEAVVDRIDYGMASDDGSNVEQL